MIGEERYSIAAGQGFLLVPGQTTTYRADDHDPWEYTWIEFDGLRAHEALQQAGIGIRHPIYTSASKEAGNLLRDCMLMMVEHTEYSPFGLSAAATFFWISLLHLLPTGVPTAAAGYRISTSKKHWPLLTTTISAISPLRRLQPPAG